MMRESVKASVAYPGYEDGAIAAMKRSRRRKKNGRRKDVFRVKVKSSCKLNREREKSMIRKKIFSPQNIVWSALLLVFVGAAIVDQVRRPPQDRTWYGKIVGIPYDFRFPTVERIRATFWNRNTPHIFVPQVFGIGWTINLYPLIHPETSI